MLQVSDLLTTPGLRTLTEVDLSAEVAPGFTGKVVQVGWGHAPEGLDDEGLLAWMAETPPVSVVVTSDGRPLARTMHDPRVDGPTADETFFWVTVGEGSGPLGHGWGDPVSRKATQVG